MVPPFPCPAPVRKSLTWSLAIYFALALVVCAMKPRHLVDDNGQLKTLGVSSPETMSIFAAPVVAAMLATSAVFIPLVTQLSARE